MKNAVAGVAFPRAGFWIAMLLAMSSPHGSLRAALTWDTTALSIVGDPDETEARAVFRFKNDTDHPIKVAAVNPSCSCTTAEAPSKSYAPGERGEMPVNFHYGGAVESQTKTILVTTDEPDAQPVYLKLTVSVEPPSVELRPLVLLWPLKQPAAAKSIRALVREGRGFDFARVEVKGAGFQAEAKSASANGREHEIVVTPLQTAHFARATLVITFNRVDKPPKSYNVTLVAR